MTCVIHVRMAKHDAESAHQASTVHLTHGGGEIHVAACTVLVLHPQVAVEWHDDALRVSERSTQLRA